MRVSNPPEGAKGFVEFIGFSYTCSDEIASLAFETYELEPPLGYAYQLMFFDFKCSDPAGSTLGTHQFRLNSNIATFAQTRILCTMAHTDDMEFEDGVWLNVPSTIVPPEITQHLLIIPQIWGNNGEPIKFLYENGSDVATTQQRRYRGQYAKYKV